MPFSKPAFPAPTTNVTTPRHRDDISSSSLRHLRSSLTWPNLLNSTPTMRTSANRRCAGFGMPRAIDLCKSGRIAGFSVGVASCCTCSSLSRPTCSSFSPRPSCPRNRLPGELPSRPATTATTLPINLDQDIRFLLELLDKNPGGLIWRDSAQWLCSCPVRAAPCWRRISTTTAHPKTWARSPFPSPAPHPSRQNSIAV